MFSEHTDFVTSALMVLAVLVPLVFIGPVAVNQLLALGDSLRQALLDPDVEACSGCSVFQPRPSGPGDSVRQLLEQGFASDPR